MEHGSSPWACSPDGWWWPPRDEGTRIILKSKGSKKSIQSGVARIDRMRDAEIDYPDIPSLDKAFIKKTTMPWPP
jgi:hypothetical protein